MIGGGFVEEIATPPIFSTEGRLWERYFLYFWVINVVSFGKGDEVTLVRLLILENKDQRSYESVVKDQSVGVKPVNALNRYRFGQVFPDELTVVSIKELRRDEPCGNSAWCEAEMSAKNEVNIKARQTGWSSSGDSGADLRVPSFGLSRHVMVADVWRICNE